MYNASWSKICYSLTSIVIIIILLLFIIYSPYCHSHLFNIIKLLLTCTGLPTATTTTSAAKYTINFQHLKLGLRPLYLRVLFCILSTNNHNLSTTAVPAQVTLRQVHRVSNHAFHGSKKKCYLQYKKLKLPTSIIYKKLTCKVTVLSSRSQAMSIHLLYCKIIIIVIVTN